MEAQPSAALHRTYRWPSWAALASGQSQGIQPTLERGFETDRLTAGAVVQRDHIGPVEYASIVTQTGHFSSFQSRSRSH